MGIILKIALFVLTLASFSTAAQAVSFSSSNFTMIFPSGTGVDPYAIGGTNDVVGTWDGTLNTSVAGANFNMTLSSPTPFFGIPWYAHDIRAFGPGTYVFNTGCTVAELRAGTNPSACAMSGPSLSMTVGPNQIGSHMLFNWGINSNIDVVNVWDMNAKFDPNHTPSRLWTADVLDVNTYLAQVGTVYATDTDAYGAYAKDLTAYRKTLWNFTSTDNDGDGVPGVGMKDGPFLGYNASFNLKVVPIPAALWLFGSGLMALLSVSRRRKPN